MVVETRGDQGWAQVVWWDSSTGVGRTHVTESGSGAWEEVINKQRGVRKWAEFEGGGMAASAGCSEYGEPTKQMGEPSMKYTE